MPKSVQLELPFRQWGGARKGAGRKPKGLRAGVSHLKRGPLSSSEPVHVTVRLCEGLPCLRFKQTYRVLRRAFAAGRERFGFRLVQYSVQRNHLHLVVEAEDRRALSRGMKGLLVRIARGLNKLWERAGKVFSDRFHEHILRTPRQVRNVLRYVMHNAKHHGLWFRRGVDLFTSAAWFRGWRDELRVTGLDDVAIPVVAARSWLLRVGWRRHGLIGFDEVPGRRPR